jgi:hypothetical protein
MVHGAMTVCVCVDKSRAICAVVCVRVSMCVRAHARIGILPKNQVTGIVRLAFLAFTWACVRVQMTGHASIHAASCTYLAYTRSQICYCAPCDAPYCFPESLHGSC